jgi:hypothetical protein
MMNQRCQRGSPIQNGFARFAALLLCGPGTAMVASRTSLCSLAGGRAARNAGACCRDEGTPKLSISGGRRVSQTARAKGAANQSRQRTGRVVNIAVEPATSPRSLAQTQVKRTDASRRSGCIRSGRRLAVGARVNGNYSGITGTSTRPITINPTSRFSAATAMRPFTSLTAPGVTSRSARLAAAKAASEPLETASFLSWQRSHTELLTRLCGSKALTRSAA